MVSTTLPPNCIETKRVGNYKPGPGRPPGRKNNRTLEIEEAARQAAAKIVTPFEGDAHAFLASVYRNPDYPLEIRILAAGRALRVEKPVLSAVQGRMEVNFSVADRLQAARRRVAQRNDQAAAIIADASHEPPLLTEGAVAEPPGDIPSD